MSEHIQNAENQKDEINVESDTYQTNAPYHESCDICLKPFENEPKIRCAECITTTLICMQCFALGLETQTHRCSHNYHIDCRHIPVDLDTDWSLQEDYDLLQRVLEYGYGNYVALNKGFPHRTIDEIRIRIDELLGLDKAPLRACLQIGQPVVNPFNADTVKNDPPRFPCRSGNSKQLAGYSAPRGDFETEFANNAEEMLKHVFVNSDSEDDDDDGLGEEITCALVECYNHKLQERALRKRVVKNYGLIKRTHLPTHSRLAVFMQFMDYQETDELIEGMNLEWILQSRMRKYIKYRNLGITRIRSGSVYEKLEAFRAQENRHLNRTLNVITNSQTTSLAKRPVKVAPIDVSQFAGYENLTQGERDLCSVNRIIPEKFIEIKKSLIDMNRNEGGVRLMAARALLKIDVNKTRRIFNYLRDEGLIKAL